MKAIKRQRLGEKAWRVIMGRFEAADMAVSEFCAREGLSTQSFYRWRSRLAVQLRGGALALPRPSALSAQPRAGFIELGALREPPRADDGGLELRLELGGGIVLQITRQ